MPVKVCDALCGFGKTSACIKMMNERVDTKFIFVTQFLSEVERIKKGCSSRGFVSPDSNLKLGLTKLADIQSMMLEGKNIATTHSLFVSYTEEIKEIIREQGYVLILDESVDIMCVSEMAECDLDILKRGGAVEEDDAGMIMWTYDDYLKEDKGRFKEEMLRAKSKNFLRFEEDFFFWSIPPELFTCFKEIYVLTYMFQAQPLKSFFEIHNIEYEYIGVHTTETGYNFCDASEMNRAVNLKDKIHILDDRKINAIGDGRTSLSFSWYRNARRDEESAELERLRKNVANVFKNVYKAPSRETLWTTFKDYTQMLRGNGYYGGFIPYNMRASNEYANRKYLAYCVNNFPRPMERRYYQAYGSDWDGDMYALSILIQWVFRSAIRKGEEVWLYLPSERMRVLFKQWLDNLADGEDLTPVKYVKPRVRKPKTKIKKGKSSKQMKKNKEIKEI